MLFNACASSPDAPAENKIPVKSVPVAEVKNKLKQNEQKTAIAPDVMFMLMTAEIAGQRGQYDVALEAYLEAAKRANAPRFAERAAVIAMYLKDNKKTSEAVSLWLKRDPNNDNARKIATLTALKNQDRKAAIENLGVLFRNNAAGFEQTVIELATVLQKDGRIDGLYDALEGLSLKYPKSADIYFVKSLLAMQMKKSQLADTQIKKALNIQPDWEKALIFEAQIAVLSGDMNKAKLNLRNISLRYPKNEKIKKLLAQVLLKNEDYDEAIEVYRGILLTNPNDAESEFTLGLLYLQIDKDAQAEALFKSLVAQPEWQSQASFYLGRIEEQRGNNTAALVWFDKVNRGNFVFDASMAAVTLLVKEKRFAEVSSRLAVMQTRFPKQKMRLLILQAEIYSQQKQYQKAFDLVTNALDSEPEQKELLYMHALLAERLHRVDILEADLKKIIAKEPNNSEALNALGYSLLGYPDRLPDAQKYLQKALDLRPGEAVIIDSYGWLQFKSGHPEKALSYLQRAYAKQQENEIAAHIAEVLWALGKKDEAKKFFDRVYKKAPDDEYLLDFKRRILNGS